MHKMTIQTRLTYFDPKSVYYMRKGKDGTDEIIF